MDAAVVNTDTIDLAELLSTCIDACRRGCEVIRNVRHKSVHGTADILDSVLYKIADDPRSALTEADGASQKVIIECLTRCWEAHIKAGRIKIVGEEEDEHSTDLECDNSFDTAYSEDIMSHFDNYNCPRPDLEPIQRDMFLALSSSLASESSGGKDPPEDTNNTIEENTASSSNATGQLQDEIIIFIDPMDGTREFVEGRIQNVQCLIGITINGVPVAGAMGMPMVHDRQIEIAYGLISPPQKQEKNSNEESEESSSVVATPVPILSGVKFFESINPLDILPVSTTITTTAEDNDDDGALMIFSGDSMKPALNIAMDCLENRILLRGTEKSEGDEGHGGVNMHPPTRKIVAGGCGHKILSLQRHVQSLISRHARDAEEYTTVGAISIGPPGSSSWDTAAPTAVLLAVDPNARVTDLLGQPLIYDGENLSNKLGVVVSSGYVATRIHDALCRILSQEEALHEVLGVTKSDDEPQSISLELDNL